MAGHGLSSKTATVLRSFARRRNLLLLCCSPFVDVAHHRRPTIRGLLIRLFRPAYTHLVCLTQFARQSTGARNFEGSSRRRRSTILRIDPRVFPPTCTAPHLWWNRLLVSLHQPRIGRWWQWRSNVLCTASFVDDVTQWHSHTSGVRGVRTPCQENA